MDTTVAIKERRFGPKNAKAAKKVYALRQLAFATESEHTPSSQL
jgi:hypothetical protein